MLTAQPSLDSHQITRRQFKLAMSVGTNRHYRIDQIHARHFLQTAQDAGIPKRLGQYAIEEIADIADKALSDVETQLPDNFPADIHRTVASAVKERLRNLEQR